MKTTHLLFAAALVAAGMATVPARAVTFLTDHGFVDTFDEDSGFAIFGFNIAFAGYTPAAVKHFVAGLNATQKRSVEIGCNEVLREPPASVNMTVLAFCRNYRS